MIYNFPKHQDTKETWVIDENADLTFIYDLGRKFDIPFVSKGQNFNQISVTRQRQLLLLHYDNVFAAGSEPGGTYIVMWGDDAYRTITFLEPPTDDLREWLIKNGVKQ